MSFFFHDLEIENAASPDWISVQADNVLASPFDSRVI